MLNTPFTKARKGTNYIFSIAIDDYPLEKDKLKNSKNDATKLTKLLTSKYRFEQENVEEKFDKNATREGILEQLRSYRSILKEDDSLVILYSGHASVEKETGKGYLLPYDKKDNWSSCISYAQLTGLIKDIKKPRHIILFLNCCYAGSFFANNSQNRGGVSTYLDKKFLKKSRYAFAAGERNQKTLDESHQQENISPFTEYIIKFLEENKGETVSIRALAEEVTQRVAQNYRTQTPIHEVIQDTGHDGGEFSFQLKENEEEVWYKAFKNPTIESLTDACQRFPNSSENVEKAKILLNKLEEERNDWVSFLALTKQKLSTLIDKIDTKAKHYPIAKQTFTTLNNEYKKLTDKDEALKRFQEIQNEKDIDKKISLSKVFLDEFSKSQYCERVQNDYNYHTRLKQQKIDWIKFDKMAQDVFKPERKIAMYKAFLKDHFFGEYVDRANGKIKDIEKFIEISNLYETNKLESLNKLKDYDTLYGTDGIFSFRVRKMIKEVEELKDYRNQKDKLEIIKNNKSVKELQQVIESEDYDKKIRIEAIQFLKELKEEIASKLENARSLNDLGLFYKIFNTYKDYELVEEARSIFNQKLKNTYEKAIEEVRKEKNVEPLRSYIKNHLQYKHHESAQIDAANKKIEEFEEEKEEFEKLVNNDNKNELMLNHFLEKFPNSIWKDDILLEIEKLKRKIRGDELYHKCITEQKFKDLQEFVVEYEDSPYLSEIYPIYLKKRAENSFFKIKALIDSEKREEAKNEVLDYIANNKEYEHYDKVVKYKKQLEVWNEEDEDFQNIQSTTSLERREQLCYKFLSNDNYTRHRKKVKQFITSDSNGKSLLTGNNNVQKSNFFSKKEVRLMDIILTILLIALIIIGILIYSKFK